MSTDAPDCSESLTEAQVRHVAKLARLAPTAEEVARDQVQLAAVLKHVAKLQSVNVSGVEPMAQPFPASNHLAADEPGPCLTPDQALANAPKRLDDFFAVPKVLGEGSA
ncbi:MAG: Asp-tRNA(Asn)/Glu-tRNA(Gln) amidotransferase subunit GatC [Planctomycetota bacterium]|nr:Asp-tRNA(Asn)/Glu-tRNA(Gln) amidotransferase subunit GatC [Planctomycetota bacterium]MDA1106290.1 Asp-tRNA(Asn)/Glu-tRNA(Gln) amidotransferase subunit GatC [Planctomycetota bacterium]